MPVIDSRGTRPIVQSGDLAFLQQKQQEGKLKTAEGSRTSVGDICTVTASSGKDLYLAKAKVSVAGVDGFIRTVVVELKAGAVGSETVIETFSTQMVTASNSVTNYEFAISGIKVTTGQNILLEATVVGATTMRVNGVIEAWEESSNSQSFGGNTVTFQSDGGDISFLRNRSRDGDLVELLSTEFSADGDQIIFVPPNDKTFYLFKAKLYPVVNTVIGGVNGSLGVTQGNRRADIEITNDGIVIDVLTHDHEAGQDDANHQGNATAWQYESNSIANKLIGDGLKEYKLVSTNTSGTYRVKLVGWLEDT